MPDQAEASSIGSIPAEKKETTNDTTKASQAPVQYTFIEEGMHALR